MVSSCTEQRPHALTGKATSNKREVAQGGPVIVTAWPMVAVKHGANQHSNYMRQHAHQYNTKQFAAQASPHLPR